MVRPLSNSTNVHGSLKEPNSSIDSVMERRPDRLRVVVYLVRKRFKTRQ